MADEMTVEQYLESLPAARRDLVREVHETLSAAVPELAPRIAAGMGPAMIGYGTFHYKYASGREGDTSLVMLANRKAYVSVYMLGVEDGQYVAEANAARLGNVSVGKSCIRFKKREDIDLDVLAELARTTARLGVEGSFAF